MKKESDGMYYTQGSAVPETPKPGDPPKPWGKTNVIGKKIPRVDAYERVSGTAVYPSDLVLPRMLYGAVLRCPHPHAMVRGVDTRKALPAADVLKAAKQAPAKAEEKKSEEKEKKE